MTNPKTTVTIYISKDLLKQIDTKATAQNRKRSNQIETDLRRAYLPQ